MIATSAAYKTAVDAHRHHWTFRATIDYTDYNLDGSIATSVDESDRLSDDAQLSDSIERTTWKFFPSWERFAFGNGYRFRSDSSTRNEKGALSYQLSDGANEFHTYGGFLAGYAVASDETVFTETTQYPRFTVSFAPRTVRSLLVAFDQKLGEWAVDFDVNIYAGSSLEASEVVTGNTTWRWSKDLASEVLVATRVDVIVKSWNYPWSKAKVVESFTSVREEYESDDIIALSFAEESEPDDSTVPIGNVTANSCNLTLLNQFRKFDNDNPDSALSGNIIKNRRIRLFGSLADQEISLGTYYSKRWTIDHPNIQAEVSGQDIISLMGEQSYRDSKFIDPQANVIAETYNTDADFNAFSRENVGSVDDTMVLEGAALYCDGASGGTLAGFAVPQFVSEGQQYCGTAERTISFTYTVGTTVTMTVDVTASLPTGTGYIVSASHKATDEWTKINGAYVFTPENPSETSQTVKIRIELYSYSTDTTPRISEISVDGDENVSLYSLAALVFDDFDTETKLLEGRYVIDDDYGDIIVPNAYLEPQSMRSVLRRIAEAGAGRAYVDRTGQVVVTVIRGVGESVKEYDESNYFDIVNPVDAEAIYNRVTVVTQILEKATVVEQIGSVDVEPGTNDYTVEFTTIPSEFDSFDEPAGVTVTDYTEYTWGMDLTVENTNGSSELLGIDGLPYETRSPVRVSRDDTESIRRSGVMEYVIEENPLIQTREQATLIAEIMIDSFARIRRQTRIDAVPDLSLEVGDTIVVDGLAYVVNSAVGGKA